jgi:hypothetical protein
MLRSREIDDQDSPSESTTSSRRKRCCGHADVRKSGVATGRCRSPGLRHLRSMDSCADVRIGESMLMLSSRLHHNLALGWWMRCDHEWSRSAAYYPAITSKSRKRSHVDITARVR